MLNKINDIESAKKVVLEQRPGMRITKAVEKEKCFVISVVPSTGYSEKDGLYIGGATRVDKKTGKVSLYNPMLEGKR